MSGAPRIAPRPAPPRHPVLRPWRVERSARCINCGVCARACTFECHARAADDPRRMADPKADCCRRCLACVLHCPRGALSVRTNDAFFAQGDATWTPETVLDILEQAAEGRIPVSGGGYGGPFDGTGFDAIWTDMSEIVRPTRDGIHGREQISTTVSLGRRIEDLTGMAFDAEGNLATLVPPTREISIPLLFGAAPFPRRGGAEASLALAASRLGTYVTVPAADSPGPLAEYQNHLVVRMRPDEVERRARALEWATIVELAPGGDAAGAIARARRINPHLLTILAVDVAPGVERTVLRLAGEGAETIHLAAGPDGAGPGAAGMIDALRASHRALVEGGLRDRVTLLASGGIARAEHVPKAILLGADAIVVDCAPLVAMECALCGGCARGEPACPRGLDAIDPRWGAVRVINLALCWRDQLLEVLGAMGLRDVRRLRGETGRAMFADRLREGFQRSIDRAAPPDGDGRRLSLPPGQVLPVPGAPRPAPARFAAAPGAWRVAVDPAACTHCGACAESCRPGVLARIEGKSLLEEPDHGSCIGPQCAENDWCCMSVCPAKAIRVEEDPAAAALGDRRWTGALLRSAWRQARAGLAPSADAEERTGGSGGGFDAIDFKAGELAPAESAARVDLSIPLNRRDWGPRLRIPLPMYGGGMSYGSVSLAVMTGRAMAARELGTFTSTGEGGYPDELVPWAAHVITQIATGLFGVREETIRRARVVELKYAQGAKPGLGGHLLGEKNTPVVAAMREAVPGTSLFSPFPFHSVYSVEDHKKHLDWVRTVNPDALLSVKVSTPADVDMVAVGSYFAGANVIHLDGSYGGTGAAPDIAKKNIAQPIEYAVVQAHDFLVAEGIRDQVVLVASGGVRTPEDLLKAVALGADGVVLGTAELVALDCVRCGNCERGRGCPIGIATTDPALASQLDAPLVRDRIVNLYAGWADYLRRRLVSMGLSSIAALRGRRDLLRHRRRAGT